MGQYRITFRSGQKQRYGEVSAVLAEHGYFLFLERGERDQLGMVGKDGEKILFSDCLSVHMQDRQGHFGGDDQIGLWKQSAGVWR